MLIALVFALGLGIIASITKNSVLLNIAKWVQPVGAIWIGFLRMTILPLVIALLITAITGMGKTKSLGSLIKKTGVVFLALNVITIVVTLVVVPPLLKLVPSSLTVPLSMQRTGHYFIDSQKLWSVISNKNTPKVFQDFARKGKSSTGWFNGQAALGDQSSEKARLLSHYASQYAG